MNPTTMILSDVFVRHTCQARAGSARPGESGTRTIGAERGAVFPTANVAVVKRVEFQAALTATWNTGDGSIDSFTAPVAQVETCTAAGAITAAGNMLVTITGRRLAQDLYNIVPVTIGCDIAAAIAATLRENAELTRHYIVGKDGNHVSLTAKFPEANDDTLNISIGGTVPGVAAAGFTEAGSSANTTAGAAGVVVSDPEAAWDTHTPFDFLHAEFHNRGTGAVTFSTSPPIRLAPGCYYVGAADITAATAVELDGQAGAILDILIYGRQH